MSADTGGGKPPPAAGEPDVVMDHQDGIPSNDVDGIAGGSVGNRQPKYIDLNNKYRKTDSGPYMVYVEHKDKNIGRLFPIKVGYYLQRCDNFRNNILDIKSVGYTRVKVIFKTFSSANDLVESELITKNDLVAFIPRFFTQTKGIVRMVDTFFTDEYLVQSIVSDVQVVDVERMMRRTVNERGESVAVKRQMIIISFLGSEVPSEIVINSVLFPVERYIYPVVQCFRCFNYGHTAKLCKSSEKCKICGEIKSEEHDSTCNKSVFCIHCKSQGHSSVSKKCPKYTRQHNIKRIMASEKLSFKEAEKIVSNRGDSSYSSITISNRYALLSDPKEFPPLPTSASLSSSNQPIVQKVLNKRKRITPPSPPTTLSPPDFQAKPRSIASCSKPASVLPNPHRFDFQAYKSDVAEKLSGMILNILNKYAPQVDINSMEKSEIKEDITTFCEHLAQSFPNKNGSAISSETN